MTFDVLYIDPPWVYENKKTGGSHTSGAVQQYRGLTVDELCALPVRSIAAKSAVLFLWATTPLGQDPYRVMEAWGFTFKTKMYWHKAGRKGLGYWTRGCVEELLIGTRGPVTTSSAASTTRS
jgi:N6-adenosine-specific RNA methylase IME4